MWVQEHNLFALRGRMLTGLLQMWGAAHRLQTCSTNSQSTVLW